MRTSVILSLIVVVGFSGQSASANDAVGQPTCCAQCGRHVACVQKTCQVVCDVKKETKTSWSVQCQEFCPLMPGCCLDRHDCCPPPPRCGHSKCVKRLVKNEYQVDVPVYKCVVRYLCAGCCGEANTSGSTAPVPPAQRTASPPMAPTPAAPMPPSQPKP
jgi:hypothetical protein